MSEEAYCVDSGAPIRYESGDRCIKHGAADTPCHGALRSVPKCQHTRWPKGANGSNKCPECGKQMSQARCVALAVQRLVTEARSDAWDEGRRAVSEYAIAEWDAMSATDPMPKPPQNPYRSKP